MFDPNNLKGMAQEVNDDFNREINPLLSKWSRSEWAGAIAVGFGVALLAIGAVAGFLLRTC